MRKLFLATFAAAALAGPAFAAGTDTFWTLKNTDFVVLLGFILFIAVLVYFKVPGMIGGLLDKRADGIRNELDEARALREEAQTLLASYERKAREVQDQAAHIVARAKDEAEAAAVQAKADMEASVARRLAAAESQIASAEASAVKEVRDRAVAVAVAAARDVVAAQMTDARANALVDTSIDEIGAKLH